ncbi:hypothetical protein AAC387_Pa02g0297 [Persea americana]
MERSCDSIRMLAQLYRYLKWRYTHIFQFSYTLRGGKHAIAAFTAALIGGKVDFSDFLRSERRKSGNLSFTAAFIGGNVNFPAFLHSEKRKTGNCSFTAALFGGKADFPVFLRSERRKTENCRYNVGAYGRNLSIRFFYHFSHLLLVGGSWAEA